MKKRAITVLLVLAMVVPLAVTGAIAVGSAGGSVYTADPITQTYFYDQLNERAKAIYDKLYEEFTSNKSKYYDGTQTIDLMGVGGIDADAVKAYVAGNKDIFNDFSAAKDALDLDHPEIWWIDSGYLTFRATMENGNYHVLIGPGRGDTYLLAGKSKEDLSVDGKSVEAMDQEINEKLDAIVAKAREEAAKANAQNSYTESDKIAALVRSVHDQITLGLSYRYETDCDENEGLFIRTVYALATKKGVCEAYARSLQVCLSKLGIECVLIHGLQTKGTPEDHMWNAVNIPDNGKDRWYAVDATWDDPVSADYQGVRDTSTLGSDGKEHTTYLLVGQNVVGEYWRPSGYVSTGLFEFAYPTIETSSFNGSTAYGGDDGLKVEYSAGKGSMEEGTPAGVFTVTFQGMNMTDAAKNHLYFMIKMYDYHPDGTVDAMDEWYYAAAAMKLLEGNEYFFDGPDGLHVYTATCDYVEVAVTTRAPENYEDWDSYDDWSYHYTEQFFQGTEDEIIAQSGMLYNANSDYEAPPYVFSQTPIPNAHAVAGCDHRFDVIFDDELYHPLSDQPASIDAFTDNTMEAAAQSVRVRYTTIQDDLHSPGNDLHVTITGELPFDADRDGYVDMDPGKNAYVDFAWHYVYEDDMSKCPNAHGDAGHVCNVEKGCHISGVSFNFRASDMWQDDITEYSFQIEGVVGSRSNKFPNVFGVICYVPGQCPSCYRSQGIDWNLWGKPTLLDAPENLNLAEMAAAGGTDKDTLEALQKEMNTSDLNGRLMLVVEDKSKNAGNREEYEKINGYLEGHKDEVNKENVLGSSVFEINFNRICPAVKLKPGQSLRVQVGYPVGVTYEDFKNGEVELKAYHFTRCDADHNCGNSQVPGHKWGDDIVSVEEITLIPTPYGMVIMCSAFSPFEIVAVKRDTPAAVAAADSYTVVVVESANGTVKVGDKEAVGEDGNITLANGESKIVTVTPDPDYVVDTVALGGVALTKNDDGTYTLKGGDNVKSNDVLSVTFVPESVKEENSQTLVSKACIHPADKIVKIQENGHTEDKKATCTENGYVLGTKCQECGTQLTQGHVIHATGHDPEVKAAEKLPTCTEAGNHALVVCKKCGETISDGAEVPATGHHIEVKVEKEPTCTESGQAKEKCLVCGEEETVTIPALGHKYKDGKCTVCGEADPDYTAPTTPTEPEPTEPEPTEPEPTEPEPTEPEPTEPEPTEPEPTEPEPTEPEPTEPSRPSRPDWPDWPTDPEPTEPEPTEPVKPSDVFTDIPKVGYERDCVDFVVDRGLILGVAEKSFSPYTFSTRGQAMTVLARLFGVETGSGPDWDKAGIQWAIENGLTDDASSDPVITRGELMYMMWMLSGHPDADQAILAKFADASKIPDKYATAMAWAVEKGIMAGVGDPQGVLELQPDGSSQRVMLAAFIMRLEKTM